MDRDWNPNVEMSPSCPRCGSFHTKFCYYNNYSLTQPRYFCKGCRRYWTKGGSIRNVPVGGGCRKNRRGNNNNNNKSLRLSSNEGIVLSRSLDDLVTKHPYEYDYNYNHLSSSSSHIDLAVVFANFLNPKPDPKHSGFDEIPADLPHEFDPLGLEFANVEVANNLFSNSDDGLPPLPGDGHLEAVSGDILWPDDDDHSFQMVPQPLIGMESHEDPDHLLFGNWSPFQFSR